MVDLLNELQKSRTLLFVCGVYALIVYHKGIQYNYVGSSKNIYYHLRDHIKQLRKNKHHNTHLQSLWNIETESNFLLALLESCSTEDKIKVEKIFIECNGNLNIEKNPLTPKTYSSTLKGKTYLEIYGTSTPPCGFKSGEQNIGKQLEIRKLLSQRTTQQWKEGRGKSYPKSQNTRKLMSEKRKLYWERKKCEQLKEHTNFAMVIESINTNQSVPTSTAMLEK